MFQQGGNMMNLKLRKVNTLSEAVIMYCQLDVFNLRHSKKDMSIDMDNIVNDIEKDMDVLTENLDMSNLDKYIFYEDKFIEDMNEFISMM